MYKFRPYNERNWRMRERIRDRVMRGDAEMTVLKYEAAQKFNGILPIIKKAMTTKYLCERVPLLLEDEDYFVGNKGKYFCGYSGAMWPLMIDIEHEWTLKEDGLWHNPPHQEVHICISQEDIDTIREISPKLFAMGDRTGDSWMPDGAKEFFALEACDYGRPGRPGNMVSPGHLTPGWPKIINVGYGAIRKQAQDFLDAHEGNIMGDDMRKYVFYKAVALSAEAATILVKRYAALCAEKAGETSDEARKAELLKMADSLEWISENPARNFWEALQGVLLYQLFLGIEGGFPAPAFGRFDQYTYPFLKKELDAGTITLDEAQDLCDAFFLKANTFYVLPGFGKMAQTAGIGNTYQHTTIGGVDPVTGEDASNPVTYMVLESVGRLKLHDPTISLRINKNTPDSVWECALETQKLVGGLPLFQNDEVIIPGLIKELDFELQDARDYSIIGCQEVVGSGCDYPAPNGMGATHAGIWYGIALVMSLNDGINPMSGKQAPVHFGYLYDMTSMDQVRESYEKLTEYLLNWYVTINNWAEYLSGYHMPIPGLSMSMLGCMEQGKDAAEGGCKYNSYGGTATGLATVADSLTTIKYMCFDKKLCTTRELYDAFITNWEGKEPLRQKILNEVPHYGNADPYADEELKWVVDLYYKQCKQCSSQRSKVYKAGMYGAADHVQQGEFTWATPDGRHTGEPIADAMSPAQSRDVNGPTAVFLSTCCFDHTRFMDGMALNLRMHPSVLSRDDGIAKLRDMTKAYFEGGGLECQYNVIDTESLRKAQENPAEYRDLVVRIAGYSAYFVELSTELQNDIIARNENRI